MKEKVCAAKKTAHTALLSKYAFKIPQALKLFLFIFDLQGELQIKNFTGINGTAKDVLEDSTSGKYTVNCQKSVAL